MKKITYILIAIILKTSILNSKPARAASFTQDTIGEIVDIDDLLGTPEGGSLGDALGYLLTVLGVEVGNDCPEILRIIPGPCPSGGNGGFPELDPNSIPRTSGGFRQVSFPNADFFNSNSTVIERDFANLYDQEYARAEAARLTGDAGQEWLETNVAVTSSLIQANELLSKEAEDLALEAQSLTATQNVVKNMTQIQSHLAKMSLNESQINAQMQASLLALQQQQASVMQNIANLGEGIDEQNRRARLEREINYLEESRSLVYIPGFRW